MKCSTSTIELETVISRIYKGTLNLQPDFQRGEVWSISKQKKLIDTILRRWKIPPIHVITSGEAFDEVLDGQQRLVAIRDFCNGRFPIDGTIEPYDESINNLNGYYFDDLPDKIKCIFLRYEIDFIRLTDFKASEPAELFDRLNQPMKLTSSEQRNAYIGETRNQVKELVRFFEYVGASKETIGFSNSRLAYDEIIAKFCYAIELHTLRQKIIASDISDRYREDITFSNATIDECRYVLERFMDIVDNNANYHYKIKMNKATIYSWFIFIKENDLLYGVDLSRIMYSFEALRNYYKGKLDIYYLQDILYPNEFDSILDIPYLETLINIFNQRASMGSTDVSSIIYRDIILYIFSKLILHDYKDNVFNDFKRMVNDGIVYALDCIWDKYRWGENF